MRVSPKAWAAVDDVRLTVDDCCDGDAAVTRVGCRRPTAENNDLGYIGCRIVPPIRLAPPSVLDRERAVRRPFSAAGCRLLLDYFLGGCRVEQEKSGYQREYCACMSIHVSGSFVKSKKVSLAGPQSSFSRKGTRGCPGWRWGFMIQMPWLTGDARDTCWRRLLQPCMSSIGNKGGGSGVIVAADGIAADTT